MFSAVFKVTPMSRMLAAVALLPLLLPPGLCACGVTTACCTADGEDDHDACPHGDAHHSDGQDHAGPLPGDGPREHAPSCPAAATYVSRTPTLRASLSAHDVLADDPAPAFVELAVFPEAVGPVVDSAHFEQPIYLRARALLI